MGMDGAVYTPMNGGTLKVPAFLLKKVNHIYGDVEELDKK